MPIYEYKCQRCGKSFEEMLSVAAGTVREVDPCPDCGKRALKRVIGIPAVHTYYSPMHPRHMRGQRQYGKKRK
jgi:putative FmdB family regulatory protein